ncbi:MAG: WD40 repeat domain-containing protein [Armatimonadota bacterium]
MGMRPLFNLRLILSGSLLFLVCLFLGGSNSPDQIDPFIQLFSEQGRYDRFSELHKNHGAKLRLMAFGPNCEGGWGILLSQDNTYIRFGFSDRRESWGSGEPPLKHPDAVRLDQLLSALPAEPPPPPLDHRVLVSVPSGKAWKTYIYDRSNLPDEILEINRLVGNSIRSWVHTISWADQAKAYEFLSEGALALSPDGRTIAFGGWYEPLTIWNARRRKKSATLDAMKDITIKYLLFTPDSQYLIAAGHEVYEIKVLRRGSWKVIGKTKDWGIIKKLSVTSDGRYLLVTTLDGFLIFQLPSLKPVKSLSYIPDGTRRYMQCSSGRHAVISTVEAKMELWDTGKMQRLAVLDTGVEAEHVAFSPDERLVAIASNPPNDLIDQQRPTYRIRVWDIASGQFVRELRPCELFIEEKPQALLWGDNTYLLAVTAMGGFLDGHDIHVFNVQTGRHRGDFTGPIMNVVGLGLTPDGKTLINGAEDGNIYFWNFAKGMKEIRAFETKLPLLPE